MISVAEILAAPPMPSPRSAAHRLNVIVAEAEALLSCCRDNAAMQDAACIVRGYVELHALYGSKDFPWSHLRRIIEKMRRCAQSGNFSKDVEAVRRGLRFIQMISEKGTSQWP